MANEKKNHLGRLIAWPFLGVVIGIAACSDPAPNGGSTTGTTTAPKHTWNKDIGQMMQFHCGGCHYAGGAGHFDLLHYESAKGLAPLAVEAMKSGRMPPWPAASGCRDYVGDRTLPEDVVPSIEEWIADGMPVGDGEIESFMPRQFDKLRADLTAKMTEAYTPSATLTDDYRCFVLDLDFPTDTWVEGVDVTPGTPQVHHVLTYALTGADLQAAIKADTDDAGAGYTCFGGPIPSNSQDANLGRFPQQVGSWVPGFQALAFPSGSAMHVPAGSRLVMQIHYNTANGTAAPDETSLTMQTRATPPAYLFRLAPIAQPRLSIQAGDAASKHSMTITNWASSPATLAAAAGHMHQLGSNIKANILHTNNKQECVLDIPDWDFEWQMQYRFPPTAFAMVQPGDSVQVECVFDNSAQNQPVIGGVQQTPKTVTWGEGSLDEMCLMYVGTVRPFSPPEPPPTTACEYAASCIQACNPKSASCIVDCEKVTTECLGCAFTGLLGCGALACGLSLQAVQECVLSCALGVNAFGGSLKTCVTTTCPNEWNAATQCLDPFFANPNCSNALSGCGI